MIVHLARFRRFPTLFEDCRIVKSDLLQERKGNGRRSTGVLSGMRTSDAPLSAGVRRNPPVITLTPPCPTVMDQFCPLSTKPRTVREWNR